MDNSTPSRELIALVSMIDEPDPSVFAEVSARIVQLGSQVIPFLESAVYEQTSSVVLGRLDTLMQQVRFEILKKELIAWLDHGGKDMISGWLAVTRYQYPDVNPDDIRKEFRSIRQDIWLELNDQLTALEQVKVFNHLFFHIHGFEGEMDDYHHLDNSYLNRVLSRRKGNPLSMGLVYREVARSLGIPVAGVNLPEHFVLAYMGNGLDPEKLELRKDVPLFYIDAFNGGAVFSSTEIHAFLNKLGLDPLPGFFSPCTNIDIMRRMISNLKTAYEFAGKAASKSGMEEIGELLLQHS